MALIEGGSVPRLTIWWESENLVSSTAGDVATTRGSSAEDAMTSSYDGGAMETLINNKQHQ